MPVASTTRVVSAVNVMLVSWETVSPVKISTNVISVATLVTSTPNAKTRSVHLPANVDLDLIILLVSPVTVTHAKMSTNVNNKVITVMPMLPAPTMLVVSTANVTPVSLVMVKLVMMLTNVLPVLILVHLTLSAKTMSVDSLAAARTVSSRRMELASISMNAKTTRTTATIMPLAPTQPVDLNVLVMLDTLVTVSTALILMSALKLTHVVPTQLVQIVREVSHASAMLVLSRRTVNVLTSMNALPTKRTTVTRMLSVPTLQVVSLALAKKLSKAMVSNV